MLKFQIISFCLAFLIAKAKSSLITNKVCGKSTDALQAIFKSTDSLLPGECTFELIVKPETCAIRIDFEEFSFNQPTKKDNTSAYVCGSDLDLLKLDVLGLPDIKLSVLCGELSGHHIYLPTKDYDQPLLDIEIQKKLIIKVIYLGIDLKVLGVKKPTWNIKLNQLSCPGLAKKDSAKIDLNLAPIGCLQYYVDQTGIIESLNYFNGMGHYMGDLNYAICFKRYPDTCGIKLSAIEFSMASNNNSSISTDRDCDTLGLDIPVKIDILPNKDFLVISNGVGINADVKVLASKYCGNSLKLLDGVMVKTTGPLFLEVFTDKYNDLINLEIGFKIKYELLTSCIDLSL